MKQSPSSHGLTAKEWAGRQLRSVGRALNQWRIWLGLLFLTPLAITFIGAAESNFTITAVTEVVSVEPSCSLELTWNLGPGIVKAGEIGPHEGAASTPVGAPCAGRGECRAAKSVSMSLRAGSLAVIEQLPDGRWQVQLSASDAFAYCSAGAAGVRRVMEVWIDDKPWGSNAQSFTYVSRPSPSRAAVDPVGGTPNDSDEPAHRPQSFAYLLEGRIVMGAPVRDDAGWTGTSASLLREAKVNARIRAPLTAQAIPVLEETIEVGSVIDTSLPLGPSGQRASARGFARPHKDGGLEVLAHVSTQRIGITPHAGDQRDLSVTRWEKAVKSPFWQALAATFIVLTGIAQIAQSVSTGSSPTAERSVGASSEINPQVPLARQDRRVGAHAEAGSGGGEAEAPGASNEEHT